MEVGLGLFSVGIFVVGDEGVLGLWKVVSMEEGGRARRQERG